MTKIHIKHIGSIKDAAFDFKRINLFIGPQGSGKSTIAKLVSFCSWMEKKVILHNPTNQKRNPTLLDEYFNNLKEYFNFSDVYFSDDSEIYYESDNFTLEWLLKDSENSRFDIRLNGMFSDGEAHPTFENRKICYIPAERNIVSMNGEFRSYNKTYNFIDESAYNWRSIRREFDGEKAYLEIDIIKAKYHYEQASSRDIVDFEDGLSMDLCYTSTGMQTLIPLYAFIEYYTRRMYKNKQFTYSLFNEFGTHAAKTEYEENVFKFKREYAESLEKLYRLANSAVLSAEEHQKIKERMQAIINKMGYDTLYAFSRLIIEEPEQSLFPQAQIELVYDMVDRVTSQERRHDLFVTTHSQYLLYALNNCMLSYLTKESREAEGELENTLQHNINPKDVNIYQIEEGELKSYRSEDGLLDRNYFDDSMKAIMDDFYALLEYYGDDE